MFAFPGRTSNNYEKLTLTLFCNYFPLSHFAVGTLFICLILSSGMPKLSKYQPLSSFVAECIESICTSVTSFFVSFGYRTPFFWVYNFFWCNFKLNLFSLCPGFACFFGYSSVSLFLSFFAAFRSFCNTSWFQLQLYVICPSEKSRIPPSFVFLCDITE